MDEVESELALEEKPLREKAVRILETCSGRSLRRRQTMR